MLDLAAIRELNDKRDDTDRWKHLVTALCNEIEWLRTTMNAKDAAAVLHVSRRRVMELIEADRLAAWKRGGCWYIDRKTIDAYAASPRKAGRPRRTIS